MAPFTCQIEQWLNWARAQDRGQGSSFAVEGAGLRKLVGQIKKGQVNLDVDTSNSSVEIRHNFAEVVDHQVRGWASKYFIGTMDAWGSYKHSFLFTEDEITDMYDRIGMRSEDPRDRRMVLF